MKKTIAAMLVLVLIFLSSPVMVSAAGEEKDVARMWLCSKINTKDIIDHTFVYFENVSKKTLTVGRFRLAPGKTVSVGTFGSTGPDGGFGLYYNLETERDYYVDLLAIPCLLTENELKAVSDSFKDYNHWGPFLNCTFFAVRTWNKGPGAHIPLIAIPQVTRLFIKLKGGRSEPFNLYKNNPNPVYKQNHLPG